MLLIIIIVTYNYFYLDENGSGEQSFQRNSFYKPNYNVLASVTGNQVFEMGPSFLGDGFSHFYSQQLQTPFNQPNFCGMSSDSDDVWSEPDRDVSRARIGLDDTSFVPIFRNNKPKTKRNKRRISVGEKFKHKCFQHVLSLP